MGGLDTPYLSEISTHGILIMSVKQRRLKGMDMMTDDVNMMMGGLMEPISLAYSIAIDKANENIHADNHIINYFDDDGQWGWTTDDGIEIRLFMNLDFAEDNTPAEAIMIASTTDRNGNKVVERIPNVAKGLFYTRADSYEFSSVLADTVNFIIELVRDETMNENMIAMRIAENLSKMNKKNY